MRYLPGILLIISGLLGLRRRFTTFFQTGDGGEQPGGRFRLLVFSSLSNLGALLLGIDIILEDMKHPWKSWDLGFFGAVLLLLALIRTVANAAANYLRARFPLRRKNMGFGTFVGWVSATSAGYAVGLFLVFIVLAVLSAFWRPFPSWSDWMKVVARLMAGALVGLIAGVFQARVLSPYVEASRKWVWLTIAGLAVGYAFEEVITLRANLESRQDTIRWVIDLISRVGRGLFLGWLQWRALRNWSSRAHLWMVFTAAALVLGYVGAEVLLPVPSEAALGRYLARLLLSTVTASIVTGAALLWLQKAPSQKAAGSRSFPVLPGTSP